MRPSSIRTGSDTLKSRHGSRSIWHVPASNPSRAAAVSKWSITSFWALRCLAGAVIKPPVISSFGRWAGASRRMPISFALAISRCSTTMHHRVYYHHYARRQPRTLTQPKPSIAVPLGSSLQYHPPPLPVVFSTSHTYSVVHEPIIDSPPARATNVHHTNDPRAIAHLDTRSLQMMDIFRDKVALVTGGASGIGRATSLAFARQGARVAIADWEPTGAAETARMIEDAGGSATVFELDVTKANDVASVIDRIVQTYGRLDCAFNNAGISGNVAKTADYPEEEWDRTIRYQLEGRLALHEVRDSSHGEARQWSHSQHGLHLRAGGPRQVTLLTTPPNTGLSGSPGPRRWSMQQPVSESTPSVPATSAHR